MIPKKACPVPGGLFAESATHVDSTGVRSYQKAQYALLIPSQRCLHAVTSLTSHEHHLNGAIGQAILPEIQSVVVSPIGRMAGSLFQRRGGEELDFGLSAL